MRLHCPTTDRPTDERHLPGRQRSGDRGTIEAMTRHACGRAMLQHTGTALLWILFRARARPALWVRSKQPHPPSGRPTEQPPFAIVHEPQAFKAGSLMLR